MGVYYEFFVPPDMKKVREDKFAGMPFFNSDEETQRKLIQFPDDPPNRMGYRETWYTTGIMDRKLAEELQANMDCNKTFFTDLMDEYSVDCLIYHIS